MGYFITWICCSVSCVCFVWYSVSFLMVQCVGLQCVFMKFSGHTDKMVKLDLNIYLYEPRHVISNNVAF